MEEYLTIAAIITIIGFLLPVTAAFSRPLVAIFTGLLWPLIALWLGWIVIVMIATPIIIGISMLFKKRTPIYKNISNNTKSNDYKDNSKDTKFVQKYDDKYYEV